MDRGNHRFEFEGFKKKKKKKVSTNKENKWTASKRRRMNCVCINNDAHKWAIVRKIF